MGGWTCQTWCPCTSCFRPSRWCRFLTPSVPPYPGPIGWGRCITACLQTSIPFGRRRAHTWRFSGASRPRRAWSRRSALRSRAACLCRWARSICVAFRGRVAPEKGVEQAIAIAQQVGMPLKMAAKVDPKGRAYFREVVQPLLRQTALVDYIGEVGGATKDAFLGEAFALLFPIDWPEPFGLVMIEALACGTPVIAYPRGSVPEVLEHGVTGWIVEGMEEAVQAVARVPALSRARCRQVFEERFSASRMAQDYVQLYQQCLA